MAQKGADAIVLGQAVEERTGTLRECPKTRREWESVDLRGQRNRRRPSCCKTFAPLTVLSLGPRLAGTPSEGRTIWEFVGTDYPPTHVSSLGTAAFYPPRSGSPTINRYEYGTIWHNMARFRRASISENQFKKGVMKFNEMSRYTRASGIEKKRAAAANTSHAAQPGRANNPHCLYYTPSCKLRKCTYAVFPRFDRNT